MRKARAQNSVNRTGESQGEEERDRRSLHNCQIEVHQSCQRGARNMARLPTVAAALCLPVVSNG